VQKLHRQTTVTLQT